MTPTSREPAPPRLIVGVIGAGRCGAVLGAALERAGHVVGAAAAVSDSSRQRAQALLPRAVVRSADDVASAADLVLFAVPDEQLADLVAGLAAAGCFHPGQILVHTSPRSGIGVFEAASGADVLPVAIHPLLTLDGRPEDVDRLTGALMAVTTLRSLRPLGEALVVEMGGEPAWVEEEDRPAYAAAVDAVRDGVSGIVAAAARVLSECGIDEPVAALGPLVSSGYERLVRGGSVTAPLPSRQHPDAADPEEHP